MIPATVRVFVCTEPQDMRRGFDRLAQVATATRSCTSGFTVRRRERRRSRTPRRG
jgi:hypothetical protein